MYRGAHLCVDGMLGWQMKLICQVPSEASPFLLF